MSFRSSVERKPLTWENRSSSTECGTSSAHGGTPNHWGGASTWRGLGTSSHRYWSECCYFINLRYSIWSVYMR